MKLLCIIIIISITSASITLAQPISDKIPASVSATEHTKKSNMLSMAPRIMLKKVLFTGNTAVSTVELTDIATPFLNRELAIEELETVRQALIQLYIGKGYINSGVIIPDQNVENGIITFTVVESGLGKVETEGLKYYSDRFLSAKLYAAAGSPLNVNHLQEALQLLQQDSRIKRINAELSPGSKPGNAELKVRIHEASPLKLSTRFSNEAPPGSGSYRGELIVAHQNLLGFGDTLSAHTELTEGALSYGGRYSFPVSLHDTTFDVYYSRSNSAVVEEKFNGLDIRSENETIGVKVRQPFFRTSTHEFALSVTGEKRRSLSLLLGQRFSFSAGEHDGEGKVSVLRFSQEMTYRTTSSVAGLYSTINYGVALFDATTNSNLPDSRFGSWIGQGLLLSRIASTPVQGMLRATAQIAFNQLLPLEKFPIGGLGSVRGYRSNTIVRDNGINSTGELRIPLFSNTGWPGTLQLVPFIDFGYGWNTDAPNSSPDMVTGTGTGFRWQLSNLATVEAYYGYGLNKVTIGKNDLQDQGFHFQVSIDWL